MPEDSRVYLELGGPEAFPLRTGVRSGLSSLCRACFTMYRQARRAEVERVQAERDGARVPLLLDDDPSPVMMNTAQKALLAQRRAYRLFGAGGFSPVYVGDALFDEAMAKAAKPVRRRRFGERWIIP